MVKSLSGFDSIPDELANHATQLVDKAQDIQERGINVMNPPAPLVACKGDGVTDDSAAITAIINYAFSGTSSVDNYVYFPAGTYRIATNGVFSNLSATHNTGVHFKGAGWNASILLLDSSSASSEMWFYDNAGSNRMAFPTFEDLQFTGRTTDISVQSDIPQYSCGFRINTASNEQGFKFNRCKFIRLGRAFEFDGTNVASEMKFYSCKFTQILNDVYTINNTQSLNHEFFGCDIEQIYANFVVFGANGGGAVHIFGGSYILFSSSSNTMSYAVSGGNSPVSGQVVFKGVRFEIRGNYTGLVSNKLIKYLMVTFDNCTIVDSATQNKTIVDIGAYVRVNFDKCEFNSSYLFFNIVNNGGYGLNGSIHFDKCRVPKYWSKQVTFGGTRGWVSARGCYNDEGAQTSQTYWAQDFDIFAGGFDGVGIGQTEISTALKTAHLPLSYWPNSTDGTTIGLKSYLYLPLNAVIKNVYMVKPAMVGSSSINYQLVDGNGNVLAQSGTVTQGQAFTVKQDSIFTKLTTDTQKMLTLTAQVVSGTPNQNQSGGMVIVEYY